SLEFELHRKLHLARRTRIARREPGITNHTKARASDLGNAAWLAKVRMIEQVEDLPAEFDQFVLGQFHPFNQRSVGIIECRTNDDVSPQTAEVIDRFPA